jgi:hypothetical protein
MTSSRPHASSSNIYTAVAGRSLGTGIAEWGRSLGPKSDWGAFLTIGAPFLALAISFLFYVCLITINMWTAKRRAAADRVLAEGRNAMVEAARQQMVRSLNDPNLSEAHKKKTRTRLEELDQVVAEHQIGLVRRSFDEETSRPGFPQSGF